MNASNMRPASGMMLFLAALGIGMAGAPIAIGAPQSKATESDHVVLSRLLPSLNGDHLKISLVEVDYGPGGSSLPHSHPCPVIGYVVSGTYRTQLKGGPEKTLKAGESFYEAPNGVHVVSANVSSTEPAKIVAWLICDRDTPLSKPAPAPHTQGGN